MKYTKALLCMAFAITTVILYTSCDRSACKNNRPIFNEYSPFDIEYKNELVRLIDSVGIDNLEWWIKDYRHLGSRDLMDVYVQNETVCAVSVFDITNAERFEQYISVEGASYSGAKLTTPDFTIHRNGDSVNFVLHDVGSILD